jgi:hypothetical protein
VCCIRVRSFAGRKIARSNRHFEAGLTSARLVLAWLIFNIRPERIPMSQSITFKEIAAGYAVAGITLCLGLYLGMKVRGDAGCLFITGSYLLAVFIILNFTFAWGRLRGFAAKKDDGGIAVSHIIRNLVMAALVWVMFSFFIWPFAMLVVMLAR